MSFLDELAISAESPTSAWHQFVISHDPTKSDWYLFLEGKLDVPFYVAALQQKVGQSVKVLTFRCGGKRGVLAARKEVRRTHANCVRCLFLVDKDLEEFVGEPTPLNDDTFCTDTYSIENYLVSTHAIEVLWTQIWTMSSTVPRLQKIVVRFGEVVARFYEIMIPIMAWIILAKRHGLRPNVNNLNLHSLVEFSDASPRRSREAFETLQRDTSCKFNPVLSEWIRESRTLKKLPPKAFTRGKFELWFLCRFLHLVLTSLRLGETKPDNSIQVTPESLARALIGKVAVPGTLNHFLDGRLLAGGESHCAGGP